VNLTSGVAITARHGAELLLSGVKADKVEWIVNGTLKRGPTAQVVDLWKLQGSTFVAGQELPAQGPASLPADRVGPYTPIRISARPDLSEDGTIPWNVLDSGAKGDGTTDDTAALQDAANRHLVLFVPFGTYVVSDTISLRDGARVVGEALSMIRLASHAPGFGDETLPKAVLKTAAGPESSALVADIALSSGPGNFGAVLIEHAAGPSSAFFDVHAQLFSAVHTGVHVTGAGGGLFTNMWIWGADHNLTDNSPMAPSLSAETKWLGARSGIRIDSSGPTWLVGSASEHHRYVMYNLSGAADVTLLESQTEHPYWNRNDAGTPSCSAKAVEIKGSVRIRLLGTVWCSWFCTLKNGLANVTSSVASIFGVWSTGAVFSIVGDHPIRNGLIAADIY